MASPHAAINPELISLITGQKSVKDKPTVSMLPGAYARKVAKGANRIPWGHKPNQHELICGHCGRKGKYDLGLIRYDAERWKADYERWEQAEKRDAMVGSTDYIQATGYFRCKECNGAGDWKPASSLFWLGLMTAVIQAGEPGKSGYAVGKIVLFDGSIHRWGTDAEEHFLNRLRASPEDAYLWNRLGNMYFKGGRPELATVAFEQSLQVDPTQVESLWSLGSFLSLIGESEAASRYLRLMLVHAAGYRQLADEDLREILARGLHRLYRLHAGSRETIPFLPSLAESSAGHAFKELAATVERGEVDTAVVKNLKLQIDDWESFLPLAEMYMGERRREVPPSPPARPPALAPGSWGSEQRPVVVRVTSEEKGEKIVRLCDRFGMHCIIGFEPSENLGDLKKALKEKLEGAGPYAPCPCGSGVKHKFCCRPKLTNFDLDRFIAEFAEGD